MTGKRSAALCIIQLAVVLSIGLPAFAATKITTITPSSAGRGATVVISGSGFSTTPALNSVVFTASTGTVSASVTSASSNTLNVILPAGAVTGGVYVQVGTSKSSTVNFTVINLAPVVNA